MNMVLVTHDHIVYYIQIFQGVSEFYGFRGFQDHPEGLGGRRD